MGQRKVIIPPDLAYGKEGFGCREVDNDCIVMPGGYLLFRIELVEILKKADAPIQLDVPWGSGVIGRPYSSISLEALIVFIVVGGLTSTMLRCCRSSLIGSRKPLLVA